ncbi:hypothetical protein AB0M39_02845 [Streptomyces sp. NPDC051907]|uniref:hypothetical protein n=1 Tax=Streptomyces sp. NPDC051907 TaxID=3155284 RepID=UPI003413255C
MRRVRWAAAAAGVVVLAAGCGSEGDAKGDQGKDSPAASASSASQPAQEQGPLNGDAVDKEIAAAASTAGLTARKSEKGKGALADCMVVWQSDGKGAADPEKGYGAMVAELEKAGWTESSAHKEKQSTVKGLKKSGWRLQASYHNMSSSFVMISFAATSESAECAKAFAADLAKNKKS